MALRDDLVGGESYFIVEIRSLKRILDASDDHSTNAPILCFIDEVLRGTNTVERISASSEILMDFAGRGIACFAATHDIELCSLLETEYDNYHFTESIVDSDIQFSYKLLAGRADSRNAIKLLGAIGYDKSIIANAEERAGRFLSTGEWS
jgi:DNA mismatch repair ATPase MutS